ncbi:MAG: hypothetical protein JW832_18635 [Deltaproteobacteria bacterium]|nr:hypothetical protein [Deltaproteobacteria bacterium]
MPPVLTLWLVPIAFYCIWFMLLTYPSILNFSTHFFADNGDGFQNVWNIWWVNEAVARLGTHPWHTHYLHYPGGISLIPHTLNVFNGFLGIPLQWFFDLVKTHNIIVIFSFVAGGLTAFRLSWHLSGCFWGSLIAGWIFTFSNYHFAHAEGHLQLVSLEWIPLFVLMWWKLNKEPSALTGTYAGLSLLLVLLCDYYYFLYCILIGALIFLRTLLLQRQEQKSWSFSNNRNLLLALFVFAGVVVLTCGPLILGLARVAREGPMSGAHDPVASSLDLLAPFIPGGHWMFHSLTKFFWSQLPSNIHETSVHWGISTCILALIGWCTRKKLPLKGAGFWIFSLVFFTLMALGPKIHVAGKVLAEIPGPYRLLELCIPFLKLSGNPVRMSVMIFLSLGLLAGAGFEYLWNKRKKSLRLLSLCLLGLLLLEYFPKPIPNTPHVYPEFIKKLGSLSPHYGLIDLGKAFSKTESLYYQTFHRIPVFVGYTSRTPYNVIVQDKKIVQTMKQGDWKTICQDMGFRYLIVPPQTVLKPQVGNRKIILEPFLSLGPFNVIDLQNEQTGWTCKPRSAAENSQ